MNTLIELYNLPYMQLLSKAHQVHVTHHDPNKVQVCSLISIKTGGCVEDCKYCSQSSRYQTNVKAEPMLPLDVVIKKARAAISQGATRVCLGAAWREVKDNAQFEKVLEMIKALCQLNVEVCCTLGMLNASQAKRLKKAGLFAYNHNLDTSQDFYSQIITTRNYQDRLDTLNEVRKSGITVCCGGIFGLGESYLDRLQLLYTLSTLNPESVPLNLLQPISGTPLQNEPPIAFWEFLKMVAIARIVMPKSFIRLSAGRSSLNDEQHLLAFFAGANSIHLGEQLLTVTNTHPTQDHERFKRFGIN